ncbi:MAG: exodeoxyribonuclease V subunit gamma [Acidobacteria bacterium]|nr:MAG: exodeoxyribonuclease V subunit gamma [Acidobacteriota bacterium]
MRGLLVYRGNDQGKLADFLEEMILKAPLPPMQEERILVQTRGLERWFRWRFSKRNGVCSGLKFETPVEFVDGIYQKYMGGYPAASVFDAENLTWSIYNLIDQHEGEGALEKLNRYIGGDNLKRFKLSEKIADLFDQYLVYRPEIIDSWSQSVNPLSEDESWQSYLWRGLVENNAFQHPLQRHGDLMQAIQKSDQAPYPRVSCLFTSIMLPLHLQILNALSSVMEVHLFFFDPCPNWFWQESPHKKKQAWLKKKNMKRGLSEEDSHQLPGNELLHSWGQMGKHFLQAVFQFDFDDRSEFNREHFPATLLGHIQSDVFQDSPPQRDANAPPVEKDASLTIASVHNQLREVEVLYDYLLSCFDKSGVANLKQDEILVMVPDINEYAATIEAVFSNRFREHRLQYAFADTRFSRSTSCSSQFLSLLDILSSRFEKSAILSLLEFPAIRSKFKLSEDDLETVRTWVSEAGIRWGLDGGQKQQMGLPAEEQNTWKHGLERMLMGYAVSEETTVDGIYPYTAIEGREAAVLGNLCEFIDALQAAFRQCRTAVDLMGWQLRLHSLFKQFFDRKMANDHEIRRLENAVSKLQVFYDTSRYQSKCSLELVRSWLCGYLDREKTKLGFISGGITFCSMIPMRAIPFRVICVLGMNDTDFPRKETKLGFNLMKGETRPLDRDLKQSDRYLFLETLLSARERLYISFTGRSMVDNGVKQPSSVVSELLDYAEHGYGVKDLITEHPLTAYNQKYFRAGSGLFSYSQEDVDAALSLLTPMQSREAAYCAEAQWEHGDQIDLQSLVAFFKNPVKAFLVKEKGLALRSFDGDFSDEEAFQLEALEKYATQSEYVDAWKKGENSEHIQFQNLKAAGRLPHGHIGRAVYNKAVIEMKDMLSSLESKIANVPETRIEGQLEMVIDKKTVVLSGCVNDIYGYRRVVFRPTSSIKGKDVLELWIKHLFINSLEKRFDSAFHAKSGSPFTFQPMDSHHAQKAMQQLVRLYLVYKRQPMPFVPSVSYEYVNILSRENERSALFKAEKAWQNEMNYDNRDFSFNVCMKHFGIFTQPKGTKHFQTCAEKVFNFSGGSR